MFLKWMHDIKLYKGGKGIDKNPLIRKCLAVGIILLFVGVGIIPLTAQDIEKSYLPTSISKWLYVGGSGSGNYSSIQKPGARIRNGSRISFR